MMRWILLTLLFSFSLSASVWEEEDLSLVHHVNVVTGQLNLSFHDGTVQGAHPLPLIRTYTSSGAFERDAYENVDRRLRQLAHGWLIQGGWNFLPHTHLLLNQSRKKRNFEAYLAEPTGAMVHYVYSHKVSRYKVCLKPKERKAHCPSVLSGRSNCKNNQLTIDYKGGYATLELPDGGKREYQGYPIKEEPSDVKAVRSFYRLVDETLPNGHFIKYHSDENERCVGFTLKSPNHKELSWVALDLLDTGSPYTFQLRSSDGKQFIYSSEVYQKRDYLNCVHSNCRRSENLSYEPAGKHLGARVNGLSFGNQQRLRVEYAGADVKRLFSPVGPNGEELPIATFFYKKNCTEVRDVHGLLTRYHHEDQHLNRVDYFDETDTRCRSIQLMWKEGLLSQKTLLDRAGTPVFSKTFFYDVAGNVLQEQFIGNLTGQGESRAIRNLSYSKRGNRLLKEIDSDLTTHYEYKPGTDLLTAKFTAVGETILIREFFTYDKDHLLVEEVRDNGCSKESLNLEGVSERIIKRYRLDAETGMVIASRESFWDPSAQKEQLLKETRITYSPQKLPILEEIYDAKGNFAYSLKTEYDSHGRIVKKQTPLGSSNIYQYDAAGNLIYVKEAKAPEKHHRYGPSGQLISTLEAGNKETRFCHDAKGQLLSKTDFRGHVTSQAYDAFGRCIKTTFPETAEALFTYDEMGNLAEVSTAPGQNTCTRYTARRRPCCIQDGEGNQTHHIYHLNGTLKRTTHSDGTYILYTYDPLQRVTSKKTFSPQEELYCEESWEYDAFKLLAHTNENGLKRRYSYDGAGRLIAEEAAGREKIYSYGALGFLERVQEGDVACVTIHDVAGNVIDQWEEDVYGRVENRTQAFFDEEGRKIKALRHTSQGVAVDTFAYDLEGRLTAHTDPVGATTRIHYKDDYINAQGVRVLQKTITDALGRALVETYDPLSRLVSIEKRDEHQQTLSLERYRYDQAGNKTSREIVLSPLKTLTTSWKYDRCGRCIKEIDPSGKVTRYRYNSRGFLIEKTTPSGTILHSTYDGLGRQVEQKSSDGTIFMRYYYGRGPLPVELHDLVQNSLLKRSYSLFGELSFEENAFGYCTKWQYDALGRCTLLTLPDGSTIEKNYKGLHLTAVSRGGYTHSYTQFDSNGHVAEETLINNATQTTTRDLLERTWQQTTPWHTLENSYGPTSLVTATRNSLTGNKLYTYDPLDQLTLENETAYTFDSLGNPQNATLSDSNELLETEHATFIYDLSGNPICRSATEGITTYTYDALNRLTTITTPDRKTTRFTYDPLSRLIAQDDQIFLYDQEHEIGRIDPKGNITELKVLGLGVKGDIGAAVAIELEGNTYAPLHDFSGNLIALTAQNGTLVESYRFTAFGVEETPQTKNPWRYGSKRNIGGLIYFGLRFYDPSTGRWLTPDPAGSIDSPNLYLYLLNTPLNRLDLFGLLSESQFPELNMQVPPSALHSQNSTLGQTLLCKGFLDGVEVDCVVNVRLFQELKFARDEISIGKVNLFDQPQFFPTEGRIVGLITALPGINTTLSEFQANCETIVNKIPESTAFIGLYTPTRGAVSDASGVVQTLMERETDHTILTRQFAKAILGQIHKLNPEMLWQIFPHSGAGATLSMAIETMGDFFQDLMKEHGYITALAPAKPIALDLAYFARNTYCDQDFITGSFGRFYDATDSVRKFFGKVPQYDIKFIKSNLSWQEDIMTFPNHAFQGPILQGILLDQIGDIRRKYGYHEPCNR